MNKLKGINRICTAIGVAFCINFVLIYSSQAKSKHMTIRFDGRNMSADIEAVSLGEIFKKIQSQREFTVKGDESILQGEISVKFMDLAFKDGLKKILGQINYILLFDKNKDPTGVFLVNSVEARSRSTTKMRPDIRTSEDVSGSNNYDTPADGNTELPDRTPDSDLVPPTEEELAAMEVIEDMPTPGGPVEMTAEEMENFKVIKSDIPPGGAVEVTPEELESMNPSSDSQPMKHPGIIKE